MKRLKIIYKTEKMMNCNKTEISMNFKEPIAELWIGREETSKLGKLVNEMTEELKRRSWLIQDEELKISDFDKYIIDYENESGSRIDGAIYPYTKYIFENRDNPERLDELLKIINN